MKNIKLISIFCIFLMILSFTACKSEEVTESPGGGYIESVPPGVQERDEVIEKLDEETNNISESDLLFMGKWQTEDGNFTYYILEDGKLCVGSQYGVDESCTWSQEGDKIEFSFSDNAGIIYIYDKENNKLVCEDDDTFYLVRSQE